ncbi:Anaphase-promoting complex subunit 1 [Coemansia sp. RSA 2618]|nr:Anaphase-promoting complex subunit 1 [Coemansia sp. RSA 2618]
MLDIHYHTGEAFPVGLPFSVRRVCALQQGLLVQRTAEAAFAGSLPTLFSLLGPLSEFKMLGLGRAPDLDRIVRQRQLLLSPEPSRTDGAVQVFNDPNIVLLGAAASRSSAAQYVLCWDDNARRHQVYQCVIAEQHDAAADSDSLSQLSNISQLSASRPRITRQPSLSVQRRTSAVPRMSGFTSAVKNDRRSSMLGRVSFNDSPAPNYAADRFREQQQMRAEVVLQLCWTERRQRDEHCTDAQICVVQNITGADIVCVLAGGTVVTLGAEFEEILRCPAVSMAPVRSVRPGLDDLLLVDAAGDLLLVLSGSVNPLSLRHRVPEGASRIVYTEGNRVAVGAAERLVSTQVRVSRLARSLIDSLSYVISRPVFAMLWRSVVASVMHAATAHDEMRRLSSLLLYGSDQSEQAVALPARVKAELRDRAPAVMFAFRLVYEDTALHRFEPQERVTALGQLMLQFAKQHGQTRIYQALLRVGLVPAADAGTAEAPAATRQRSADRSLAIIPSLAKWTHSILDTDAQPQAFPTLEHIANLFGITDAEPASGARDSTKLLNITANVLYQLALGRDAALVLRQLASDEAPMLLLRKLSVDMQWLLCSVIESMQQQCISSWPASILTLLGRHDMIANTNERAVRHAGMDYGQQDTVARDGRYSEDGPTEPKTINEIIDEVLNQHGKRAPDWKQSARAREFSQLAFSRDLRLNEAERLLHLSAPTFTTTVLDGADTTDDPNSPKSQYMELLARRVLALPLSQALLRYSSQQHNPQCALPISHPVVAARFRGNKTDSTWTPDEMDMSWPLFHSGVAAALSVERDQLQREHPSWMLLNWPVEPADTAQDDHNAMREFNTALASHAGFLLGMGLIPQDTESSDSSDNADGRRRGASGPLSNMSPRQTFKYLSKRHGLTSIALLLGCACAHRGTMSSAVSKILSLHIPKLLPDGSSELMLLSHGTQAAAMLGLGLLYMQSQNRRMVEVMLHELERVRLEARGPGTRLDGADAAESTAECYSLASGFALGLVVLGCGLSTTTLADLRLLDTLSAVIIGVRPRTAPASHVDGSDDAALEALGSLDITSGGGVTELGAIAAIGLAFLGTGYSPAAQRLAMPQLPQNLRAADPFTLLWRALMQALIMHDNIQPTAAWIESTLPRACAQPETGALPPDLYRIRLHIVSAACFAIALKFAGTEDAQAHSVILAFFDELDAVAGKPALGYESSLTRTAAQSCLDVACVAAALVHAGSGDIPIMSRLRKLHGVSAHRTYGNHMASHAALGILFLGGGARLTISRSLSSTALLLIAFFPRFPQHAADNREHLQAWRHLWAMCVVPRCLVVRDVCTGRMCRDAVVELEPLQVAGSEVNAQAVRSVVPPVPFPELASVLAVRAKALGYMPLRLDIAPGSYTRSLVSRRRVLYMQPLSTSPTRGLATLAQYTQWLADTQQRVAAQCAQLARPEEAGRLDDAVVQAVERLRICVFAVRSPFIARSAPDGPSGCWAEETYLVWLDVRSHVLALGRRDESRRLLTRYWTGSLHPDAAANVVNATIALLYAVLDLPIPVDAMKVAKQVPISELIDYVLDL